MVSRRTLLRGLAATGIGAGTLGATHWMKFVGAAESSRVTSPQAAGTMESPIATSTLPPPLGTASGADGRPVVHDLDIGRISGAAPGTAVLNAGLGPRILRFRANSIVWFEGMEQPYRPDFIADGDSAEAAGTTLQDYSIDVDRITPNALGNLVGMFGGVEPDGSLAVFPRTGKAGGNALDPLLLRVDGRTRYFGGRGNYNMANRDVSEVNPGSWVMCNGYRTRAGEGHALECYFGDETPPADAPQGLLDRIQGSAGR